MNKDNFSAFHPLVNFCYFAALLLLAMVLMHPLYLVLAIVCMSIYALLLLGRQFFRRLVFLGPVVLFTALINALFNHQGVTILAYFPSGNPLTLESIIYALAAGAVLSNVLITFFCFTQIITAEKLIYLFGRLSPSLALVLAMTLRFIPKFQAQLEQTRCGRKIFGQDITQGPLRQRLRHALSLFSIMLTWSLENAVITADSMKSRGYGLGRRSAFSLYRFERRDFLLMGWLAFLSLYIALGWYFRVFDWHYFPCLSVFSLDMYSLSVFLAYVLLALTPVFCRIAQYMRQKRFIRAYPQEVE